MSANGEHDGVHYELSGSTRPGAETIVLSAGLGGLAGFWQPQLLALGERFRVLTYDQRGTGANAGKLPDSHGIADMAGDVVGMLDAAGIARCHFMGHALGGLIGIELALRAPSRLARLVLVNAWARADAHTRRCFAARIGLLRQGGAPAYAAAQPIFLYPAAWLARNEDRIAREEAQGVVHFQGEENLMRRIAALLAFDASGRLGDIAAPTLVAASRDDVLVPYPCSEALAAGIPNATFRLTAEGGHAFSVVDPAAFNAGLLDFLAET